MDSLTRSVYGVTAALANASSFFPLFSFLVVCTGMISWDLWHSLQVKKSDPSVFRRKLTWPWQYSHQPWAEWRPKTLHETNTVVKVKVPLFALCQQWLKLHVLHSHHDGSTWQEYSRKCHHSCWEGRVESTFNSGNDGSVLVYRPQRQRYNPQYISTCKRSGRVSVNCWGWISHEGGGILHRIEGHLDDL